ncbi:MAG TPA: nucleotidyl transferase AbiEii/AbiGii toxin family protein [Longimicrobiales bacterium]|nr:nucleotidyl transferase AbiEii/AbiGii toxin family protein [Longimicrobiales bacterium]
MTGDGHKLTPGYVARHLPPGSRLGMDIAILDIAQDFLLAHLWSRGVFDVASFKGGTALRKLFAGSGGRFSTDLDFAAVEPDVDRQALAGLIAAEAEVSLGPFRFRSRDVRGRWRVQVSSDFGDPSASMKLDVGPPAWLDPDVRAFVETPIQSRYGFALPSLPVMRLEEILAEKVARLARSSTARDASDLVWAATTSPHSRFARDTVRRLAVLKVWVDNHGLGPAWERALAPRRLDPDEWLAPRGEWGDEEIGLLAHPQPSLHELQRELAQCYHWLRELDGAEARWAAAKAADRGEVIAAIRALALGALGDAHLW